MPFSRAVAATTSRPSPPEERIGTSGSASPKQGTGAARCPSSSTGESGILVFDCRGELTPPVRPSLGAGIAPIRPPFARSAGATRSSKARGRPSSSSVTTSKRSMARSRTTFPSSSPIAASPWSPSRGSRPLSQVWRPRTSRSRSSFRGSSELASLLASCPRPTLTPPHVSQSRRRRLWSASGDNFSLFAPD